MSTHTATMIPPVDVAASAVDPPNFPGKKEGQHLGILPAVKPLLFHVFLHVFFLLESVGNYCAVDVVLI